MCASISANDQSIIDRFVYNIKDFTNTTVLTQDLFRDTNYSKTNNLFLFMTTQ